MSTAITQQQLPFVISEVANRTEVREATLSRTERLVVIDIDKIKKRDSLASANNRLVELENLKKLEANAITQIENQILQLQHQLTTKKASIEEIEAGITKGEAFIESLKDANQEFILAQEQMQNISSLVLIKRSLDEAQDKYIKFEQVETLRETLNNKLQETEALIQKLAQDYKPDIEGLEIVLSSIDPVRPEGVYLNGTNMAHLSESECWDLCLQAWALSGCRIVFIENSSSLGSAAIERINWFVEQVAYVFLSTMERNYKELNVSFVKKLE